MSVALGIQHAMRMRRMAICGLPGSTTFSHKRARFSKKNIYWTQNVRFDFLYKIFVSNISHSEKNLTWYKFTLVFIFLSKLEFPRRYPILEKKYNQISNFIKIRPVGAELFCADGQTYMAMPTVTFRNFANAPKDEIHRVHIHTYSLHGAESFLSSWLVCS